MQILKTLIISSALLVSSFALTANDENTGSGTVAESMNVGAYVYVRLKETDTWVASTPIPVAIGDKVQYTGGALMKDFYSPSLDRSFESILFAMKLEVVNPVTGDTHASAAPDDPHGIAKSATAAAPQSGEIAPLEGGKTIAEIQAEYESLAGNQVMLRARVMKVSLNILGKNWITLKDGSGDPPDDKLVVTTSELVEIGDTVTAKGIVKANVDIGAGYKYKVVLEEAIFSR